MNDNHRQLPRKDKQNYTINLRLVNQTSLVPHVGKEMFTRSGTPEFTPFGKFHDFTHSLYYVCLPNFVSLSTRRKD